jgi:predicted amidohydrolase
MAPARRRALSRRDMLRTAGMAGLTGLVANVGGASADAAQQPVQPRKPSPGDIAASSDGSYATVPLRQAAINVAAVQSRVRALDGRNAAPRLKENLAHVLELIDAAQGAAEAWGAERRWGSAQDLITFHEFPLQGWNPWTRQEILQVAIDLPGEESEAIGGKAKRYNCYIAFGCYARDKDWPNHVMSISTIVGPSGQIVSKQLKARNMLGVFGDFSLFGTTVYDVLDRYVELYGWDAVIPVARTDIGNLCMTPVGNEPDLYRCMALKGAEIIIQTVTGGTNATSAAETARVNNVYCMGVGNAVSPDNIGFAESAGAADGGTVILDPRGRVLAQSENHHEAIVSARIPIAEFRKGRAVPEVPVARRTRTSSTCRPTSGMRPATCGRGSGR